MWRCGLDRSLPGRRTPEVCAPQRRIWSRTSWGWSIFRCAGERPCAAPGPWWRRAPWAGGWSRGATSCCAHSAAGGRWSPPPPAGTCTARRVCPPGLGSETGQSSVNVNTSTSHGACLGNFSGTDGFQWKKINDCNLYCGRNNVWWFWGLIRQLVL